MFAYKVLWVYFGRALAEKFCPRKKLKFRPFARNFMDYATVGLKQMGVWAKVIAYYGLRFRARFGGEVELSCNGTPFVHSVFVISAQGPMLVFVAQT